MLHIYQTCEEESGVCGNVRILSISFSTCLHSLSQSTQRLCLIKDGQSGAGLFPDQASIQGQSPVCLPVYIHLMICILICAIGLPTLRHLHARRPSSRKSLLLLVRSANVRWSRLRLTRRMRSLPKTMTAQTASTGKSVSLVTLVLLAHVTQHRQQQGSQAQASQVKSQGEGQSKEGEGQRYASYKLFDDSGLTSIFPGKAAPGTFQLSLLYVAHTL